MSISKSYNKQNGVTYVYEVIENYWDKEKKQSRSKRKLIGKIDPVSGEMIPTTPKGIKGKTENKENYKLLYEKAQKEIQTKDKRIEELEEIIRNYLSEEMKALAEVEAVIKQRGTLSELLLRRYR